ncbi:MAG: pyridoxamine 5'-phosphate oxidase family protein [Desulfobulbaceae bacterium]|nr:pyridoxamine 5'-phosphate oxidase family protein [Desulfobulbaceae bacterium]
MNVREFFSSNNGVGVLSTADLAGKVDSAIYSRPHVMDDGSLAFIMRERLTLKNLQENPYAAYLFMKNGAGYEGVRIFLKKIREDQDEELIGRMTRRSLSPEDDRRKGPKHLVYFRVENILPLIASGESGITL